MSEASRRALALEHTCPNCNSGPGRKCTQPTDTARKSVKWVHLAREQEAAKKAQ